MGAIGLGVVTAQAVAIGITALPKPDTDADWGGWMWHSYYANTIERLSASGFQHRSLTLIPIDTKAMRKIGLNERLVLVIENSGTVGVQVYDSFRILAKLP